MTSKTEAEIERVVQSVNEWDDRTSPDEYPDHLLITSEELTLILRNFAEVVIPPPPEPHMDDIKAALAEEGLIAGDDFAAVVLRHPKLHELHMDGNRPLPYDRETLGRFVREAWVRWAETQPNPKPSWLVPYYELSEQDKEADRQIGEALARWTLIGDAARASLSPSPAPTEVGDQATSENNPD